MLVTLRNGSVEVTDVLWENVPAAAEGLSLDMDLSRDAVTIRNQGGDTVNLAGYVLYSLRGDESLTLPDRSLAPGEALVIGTKTTQGEIDVQWDDRL